MIWSGAIGTSPKSTPGPTAPSGRKVCSHSLSRREGSRNHGLGLLDRYRKRPPLQWVCCLHCGWLISLRRAGDIMCHISERPTWPPCSARLPAANASAGRQATYVPQGVHHSFDFHLRRYAAGEGLLVRRHGGPALALAAPDTERLGDLPRAFRGGCPRTTPQPARRQVFDPKPIPSSSRPPAPVLPRPTAAFRRDKGFITTGTYGENTRLVPVERMIDTSSPLLLTRSSATSRLIAPPKRDPPAPTTSPDPSPNGYRSAFSPCVVRQAGMGFRQNEVTNNSG